MTRWASRKQALKANATPPPRGNVVEYEAVPAGYVEEDWSRNVSWVRLKDGQRTFFAGVRGRVEKKTKAERFRFFYAEGRKLFNGTGVAGDTTERVAYDAMIALVKTRIGEGWSLDKTYNVAPGDLPARFASKPGAASQEPTGRNVAIPPPTKTKAKPAPPRKAKWTFNRY